MVITLLAPTARPARDSLDDLLLRGTGHILPRLEAVPWIQVVDRLGVLK